MVLIALHLTIGVHRTNYVSLKKLYVMKYLIVLVNRETEEKKVVKRCSCSLREAGNKMLDYQKKHNIDLKKFYFYLKEEEI